MLICLSHAARTAQADSKVPLIQEVEEAGAANKKVLLQWKVRGALR